MHDCERNIILLVVSAILVSVKLLTSVEFVGNCLKFYQAGSQIVNAQLALVFRSVIFINVIATGCDEVHDCFSRVDYTHSAVYIYFRTVACARN